MMQGEKELLDLQQRIEEQPNAVLFQGKLYDVSIVLAKGILNSISKKTGYVFNSTKIEEVCHETAIYVQEYIIIKRKHIDSPRNFCWLVVTRLIYNKKDILKDSFEHIELNEAHSTEEITCIPSEEDDPFEFIEQCKDGKKVIIAIYKERYYKDAILKVAEIKSRGWVYINAVALRRIFMMTRQYKRVLPLII